MNFWFDDNCMGVIKLAYLDDDPDTVLKSNTTKNEYSNTGNSTYIGIDVSKLIDTIHCLERDSDTGFLKEFQVREWI